MCCFPSLPLRLVHQRCPANYLGNLYVVVLDVFGERRSVGVQLKTYSTCDQTSS